MRTSPDFLQHVFYCLPCPIFPSFPYLNTVSPGVGAHYAVCRWYNIHSLPCLVAILKLLDAVTNTSYNVVAIRSLPGETSEIDVLEVATYSIRVHTIQTHTHTCTVESRTGTLRDECSGYLLENMNKLRLSRQTVSRHSCSNLLVNSFVQQTNGKPSTLPSLLQSTNIIIDSCCFDCFTVAPTAMNDPGPQMLKTIYKKINKLPAIKDFLREIFPFVSR